ncbi:hypothetical protein [Luteibaculum oceani]|uniref:Uncharacterized protein n=1 Tax=Luteibaculum oceani TaxID=1294296 RepID=A0A5C6UWY6_9FLAO|nr:hypothetical protein [Luteibaculum oceani]TXC77100.1 hypothetical protein FRX97_09560 [Luteibaculum oceani]
MKVIKTIIAVIISLTYLSCTTSDSQSITRANIEDYINNQSRVEYRSSIVFDKLKKLSLDYEGFAKTQLKVSNANLPLSIRRGASTFDSLVSNLFYKLDSAQITYLQLEQEIISHQNFKNLSDSCFNVKLKLFTICNSAKEKIQNQIKNLNLKLNEATKIKFEELNSNLVGINASLDYNFEWIEDYDYSNGTSKKISKQSLNPSSIIIKIFRKNKTKLNQKTKIYYRIETPDKRYLTSGNIIFNTGEDAKEINIPLNYPQKLRIQKTDINDLNLSLQFFKQTRNAQNSSFKEMKYELDSLLRIMENHPSHITNYKCTFLENPLYYETEIEKITFQSDSIQNALNVIPLIDLYYKNAVKLIIRDFSAYENQYNKH